MSVALLKEGISLTGTERERNLADYTAGWNGSQIGAFPHGNCNRDGIIASAESPTWGTVSVEDSMTMDERRKVLGKMQERYRQAGSVNGGGCWMRWKQSPNGIVGA